MNEYSIYYIENGGHVLNVCVQGVGLAEAVDTFIETYCPVQCITAVNLIAKPARDNRESRIA